MMLLRILSIALLVGGCTRATDRSGRPDFSKLRARGAEAHRDHQNTVSRKARRTSERKRVKKSRDSEIKSDQREAAASKKGKLGYVRGEGRGATRHEAVVAAISAVAPAPG